jgi:hypothetical protein
MINQFYKQSAATRFCIAAKGITDEMFSKFLGVIMFFG